MSCPQVCPPPMYAYVCMYECMYVCMHACIYVYMYACMFVCMHVCMFVYMHVCMHMDACIQTHIHAYVHACMFKYIYIYIYICAYVCMYVCMYVMECSHVPVSCRTGLNLNRRPLCIAPHCHCFRAPICVYVCMVWYGMVCGMVWCACRYLGMCVCMFVCMHVCMTAVSPALYVPWLPPSAQAVAAAWCRRRGRKFP